MTDSGPSYCPDCSGSLQSLQRGALRARDDVSDVRFWAPDELAEAEGITFRDLHEEPAGYATPGRLLDGAKTALSGLDGPPIQPDSGGS